ncbi:hypothetical protein SUGI_0730490, partial [Cryptomeria japonica]
MGLGLENVESEGVGRSSRLGLVMLKIFIRMCIITSFVLLMLRVELQILTVFVDLFWADRSETSLSPENIFLLVLVVFGPPVLIVFVILVCLGLVLASRRETTIIPEDDERIRSVDPLILLQRSCPLCKLKPHNTETPNSKHIMHEMFFTAGGNVLALAITVYT